MGWHWHQLNHMQIICTLLQTDNHASTLSLSFLQAVLVLFLAPNRQCQSTVGSVRTLTESFWPATVIKFDFCECWDMCVLCIFCAYSFVTDFHHQHHVHSFSNILTVDAVAFFSKPITQCTS